MISTTASSFSQDAPPAPFGLKWLASAKQIEALGVTLSEVQNADFGSSFIATNLPKALSDIETVFVSFGYDDQLYRVVAISREFENDHYGASARVRYEELAEALTKSYTPGTVSERLSTDSYYGKAENFAYAISQNEQFWYRTFSSADAEIELSIGSNHSDTYWRLAYTHREGRRQFDDGKGARELDAL